MVHPGFRLSAIGLLEAIMVEVAEAGGGGRFEELGSYVRAKRVGAFVFVAGTTAIEPTGKLHAPNDTYAQTVYAFARVAHALEAVGSRLEDVVRTRLYFTDISTAAEAVRAHGEIFKGIRPVTTGVEVGLTVPGMMVEVEVDAIVADLL
jgi:enamine deaminase RidA (YjgF/YER057c/UK114 family)